MYLDTIWEPRPASFGYPSRFFEVESATETNAGVLVHLSSGEVTAYALDDEVRIVRQAAVEPVCTCNGGDLPLFDHHRMCDLREGVSA